MSLRTIAGHTILHYKRKGVKNEEADPLFLVAVLVFVGCETMVKIETNVPAANVRLDGQLIGSTPLSKNLSDAIWLSYNVILEKKGYKTRYGQLNKELKVGALIGGVFLGFPLLWVYGPAPYQYFELEKE